MKKITKEDIKQEVFDLYDDYAHNKIRSGKTGLATHHRFF